MGRAGAVQASFEDLGTPLFEATFVVLDLETTGLDPRRDRITEVGAVKVRSGEVLGEFHALVSPGVPIPPVITAVTGITDAMVRDRPPIEAVLPSLVEFLRGAAFVAHNARFDHSFLRFALERLDYDPLRVTVIDTARLARRVLHDEVRDVRLATLAQHLRSRVAPNHRALVDARATVDVFHGLLERAGAYGVRTLEDLADLTKSTSDRAFRKRRLVEAAPDSPGVYRFLDDRGTVLYVGKATSLRLRLRQYFGQDPRRKIADLVRDTSRVDWHVVATPLEANVREVRDIHRHRPRYNRRSRSPERATFVKLTREPFPRLSIVATRRGDGATYVGPMASKRVAERFVAAVHDVIPLRQCGGRLSVRTKRPACLLKDLGRCGAPCDGTQDESAYAQVVDRYHEAVTGDPSALLAVLRERMTAYSREQRYERAASQRRRMFDVASALATTRRLDALTATPVIGAARAQGDEYEVVVVRRGLLAATARVGVAHVRSEVDRLVRATTGADSTPGPDDAEEVGLVSAWLAQPDVIVVWSEGSYAEPTWGGAAIAETLSEARRVGRHLRRDRDLLAGTKVARR